MGAAIGPRSWEVEESMNHHRHLSKLFVTGILAGVFMTQCFVHGSAMAADKINYRLKWLINRSTVGDVYAQAHGFYEAEGLNVEIKPGGPERDAIRELEMGYAQFGVASADQIIRAVEKGSPVVVVAQLFQVNPLHWIYRRNNLTITSLNDLKNRTLGVTFGKNDEFIMRTLLSRGGIGEKQVQLFSVRLDYTPFFKGTVDLWPVYINSQGVELEKKMAAEGDPVAFFSPADFGVRFVANSVVTSRRMLAEKPETVHRFMRALMKGWRVSLDPANAKEAIQAVRQYDKDTALPVLQAQLDTTRRLIKPDEKTIIGAIDKPAWEQTEALMQKHKQITGPVNVLKYVEEIIK
jgi:NitT/TauT family transport system substrate-binding protein